MARKLETIELDIPNELHAALMEVAKLSGLSLEKVIRVLLATYVVSREAQDKK